VLINSLEAIKNMVQSIRYSEQGDDYNAKLYEARAIRALNLKLRDDFPEDQIPVTIEPFNSLPLGFQQMF